MPKVFLSYAREDAPMIERVAKDLRAEGIDTWLDREEIQLGANWSTQIARAIDESDFLLVFLSNKSLSSKWVEREYLHAFERMQGEGGGRLIPVLIEPIRRLPPLLASIQYADLSRSYHAGLSDLLDALRREPKGARPSELVDAPKLAKEVAVEVAKLLGLPARGIPTASQNAAPDSKLVFVVMAFKPDMEPVFEGIAAAAQTLGLTAKRVKDVQGDYRITDKVVSMIESARIVVVDLTHERPNVYFELGYARGLSKAVVTIARSGTQVHFDVKDWVYLEYADSRVLERDLRKRFEFEINGE